MKLSLRPAEIEVIALLCQGKATKEIAYRLEKHCRTVENQLFQAKQRNGAKTTAHLCVMFTKETAK